MIADATEALRLKPDQALYNLRGSAYFFLRDAARAQIALVYYAGHGVQIAGRNYLIPVDVRLDQGKNATDTMIDMDTILAGLDDQVRTNILILDACRNNPLQSQAAAGEPSRGIAAGRDLPHRRH